MPTTPKNEMDFLDAPAQVSQRPQFKGPKVMAKYPQPIEECSGCPLFGVGSGFSKPEGKGSLGLMIVGEALGEAEAKDGLPLRPYAPSGSVVEKAIKQLGYDRQQFTLWNTVACRPPGNVLEGTVYERGAIEHCRTHFDKVIASAKPRAILALGNTALEALTGLTGEARTVSYLRGYVLWSDRYNLPVIPTYHPSFVRRGGLKLFWVLRHDLAKAVAVASGKFTDYVIAQTPSDITPEAGFNYAINPSPAQLQMWLAVLKLRPEGFFSYDIETAYAANQDEAEREVKGKEITQIQFSQGVGEGIALPWDQNTAEFTREVFALPNPRGNHNAHRFDNKILRLNGIEPWPAGTECHDTMTLWQNYQPDLPRGLQYVVSFFGMPFPWKHFVTQDFGIYGIGDVDAVQRIMQKLPKVMEKKINVETGRSVWDGYREAFLALQPELEGMQQRGIGVDVEGQQRLKKWIGEEQERVNAELQPLIPTELKNRQEWTTWPADCKDFVAALKVVKADKIRAELEAAGQKVTKKALTVVIKPKDLEPDYRVHLTQMLGYQWDGDKLFKQLDYSANSHLQLKKLLAHYKVEVPVDVDGNTTTGKGELRKMLKKTKVGVVIPIVEKTLEYRELGKAVGTYIDGKGWTPDEQGRVHTEFTFNSGTWQLTSTKPNIQNIAKHTRLGKEIRKLIVPHQGNVLLEADMMSFHVLTLGYNAESETYMQLARSDAHSFVCAHMLKTRIKEDTKDELELETKAHIADLDGWLALPRETFLSKLGWIKKKYGSTLRQQAKAGILGVGLGLGVDKLHSHNEDSFNPSESEAEAWLRANQKAQFYSPITRGMKPASYFPHEMQIMLAQEKLGKQAAKSLRELLEKLFPEVFRWQMKIRAQAHRDGYLVSRYGGIRWFHNVYEWDAKYGREKPGEDAEAAIAFYVQNDAFGKMREAMLDISRTRWGQYLVNTVHDSLVFDLPEELLPEAAKEIKEVMERPARWLRHPRLCPEGLVCGVELAAGKNWGSWHPEKNPEGLKEMKI